jgi:GTP-binding protein YchF
MSLSVGIVGLPNAGKSTLFNALLKRSLANVAEHPFTTIEPNVGVVEVPDKRLEDLVEMTRKEQAGPGKDAEIKMVPAVVKFVDIAGLVKGAHKGEGLGNKFLAKIREVDAIVHVVRGFEDEKVLRVGGRDAKEDYEIVNTELCLADLQTVEKKLEDRTIRTLKEVKKLSELLGRIKSDLAKGIKVLQMNLSDEEKEMIRDLFLLTTKPEIKILNVGERQLGKKVFEGGQSVIICAKLEAELADFNPKERIEYLREIGVKKQALDLLIEKAFDVLSLIRFYTLKGGREITAWPIPKKTSILEAAQRVHTDIAKGFIKAEVISFSDLIKIGSWKEAQRMGKIRFEGKDNDVLDGEVIEFKFNV